jgi:hypothetical protein
MYFLCAVLYHFKNSCYGTPFSHVLYSYNHVDLHQQFSDLYYSNYCCVYCNLLCLASASIICVVCVHGVLAVK